jgi:hypothetical protein
MKNKSLIITASFIAVTFTLIFYSCTKSEPQKQTQQQVKQTTGAGSIATIVPNGTYNYTAAISPTTKSTLTMVKTAAACTITTSTGTRTKENATVFSFDLPFVSYTLFQFKLLVYSPGSD